MSGIGKCLPRDDAVIEMTGMAQALNIPLPVEMDEESLRQLQAAATEFAMVELYRQRKLSHGKLAQALGIGRGQVDGVLGRHGVNGEFTAEEIAEQVDASQELRKRRRLSDG